MTTDRFAQEWTEPLSPINRENVMPLWRVNAVKASTIKAVPIRWLWPGWLAKGKLHILAGAGGTGKTTLLIGLIATLTTGGRWPDGSRCGEPGNALIWSSEDDPADTLIPRLTAAGADMSRVYIIQGRTNAQGDTDPFDPANDIGLLRETASDIGGVSLLMLDPIVSAVKGDMHKANDVRRALQSVVDFAEQNLCAIVGISHFAKGGAGSSPTDRVIGSQAFSALARTVLVAAKQEDSDLRVLARAKSNIGTDEGGVSYTIETFTIDGEITTTRVAWGDLIEGSAREILGDVESTEDDTRLSDDDPSEALRRILKDGPMVGKQAKSLMTENGYSAKQTRTAREKLSVVTVREGFGKEIRTLWSLPQAEGAFSAFPPFVPTGAPFVPEKEQGHEWEKRARMDERAPMPLDVHLPAATSLPSLDDDAEDL
ncbi:AAA family ATPase [Pseudomonas juntendi]|uniref:AAA family ATPase n=1 Tax=Pseudomonas juntendi TaxID=2666183 RepID=A0A7W2KCS4_9PSED|nr:AAA family ATPase [Pseudomonas juntendi]MBA6096128.1 AAA family ATPase [Pseudomonas juntendi]MBA6127945.1 AAA family ATPase [Pseudomonas juntendi]MBA6127961.1 AAA family ATPase [Pseudomonas juntendi]